MAGKRTSPCEASRKLSQGKKKKKKKRKESAKLMVGIRETGLEFRVTVSYRFPPWSCPHLHHYRTAHVPAVRPDGKNWAISPGASSTLSLPLSLLSSPFLSFLTEHSFPWSFLLSSFLILSTFSFSLKSLGFFQNGVHIETRNVCSAFLYLCQQARCSVCCLQWPALLLQQG